MANRYTVLLALAAGFTSHSLHAQISNDALVAQSLVQDHGITLAEAQRRLALLAEANSIAERLQADIGVRYGGLRVTNDKNFRVEFLVTGNAEKVLDAYTQRPEFVATSVSRSYQALKAKHDRLVAALAKEDDTFVIAVIPGENRVRVISPRTERARGALKRTNLVDESVDVQEEDAPALPVATCRGGVGLTGPTQVATSGFVVIDRLQNGPDGQPRRGIVTAAHLEECVSTACDGTRTIISGCTKNGPATDDSNGVRYNFVRQKYETNYDIEFRVPSTTGHTLTNEIIYAGTPMRITATYNPRNYAEGTFNICKQGRKTGYTCAPVVSNYATISGTPGGTFIMAEKANASLVGPGDSGGPVFVSNGAVGTTVAAGGRVGTCGSSTAYYTRLFFEPVDDFAALNVAVLTTP